MDNFDDIARRNSDFVAHTSCKQKDEGRAERQVQGEKSSRTGKAAKMLGGSVAMTLIAAGMAEAAGSEIPDGYVV
ncbi:MAG: hypothetical protein P8O10_03130, partial [Pseudorhodobacter sp.]|nr:hypothetical protein [Pseudorhodobacter sp.]